MKDELNPYDVSAMRKAADKRKQVSAWGFSENVRVPPPEQSSTPPATPEPLKGIIRDKSNPIGKEIWDHVETMCHPAQPSPTGAAEWREKVDVLIDKLAALKNIRIDGGDRVLLADLAMQFADAYASHQSAAIRQERDEARGDAAHNGMKLLLAEREVAQLRNDVLGAIGKFSDDPLTTEDVLTCLRQYRTENEEWQKTAETKLSQLRLQAEGMRGIVEAAAEESFDVKNELMKMRNSESLHPGRETWKLEKIEQWRLISRYQALLNK